MMHRKKERKLSECAIDLQSMKEAHKKELNRLRQQNYRERNREKVQERERVWREDNRESYNAYKRNYYQENRNEILSRRK